MRKEGPVNEEMDEHNIRAAIDRHWIASAAGDQIGEHEIYHDDVVCEYPQSGEIIYGRPNLQALRSHHPESLRASPSGGSWEMANSGLLSTRSTTAANAP